MMGEFQETTLFYGILINDIVYLTNKQGELLNSMGQITRNIEECCGMEGLLGFQEYPILNDIPFIFRIVYKECVERAGIMEKEYFKLVTRKFIDPILEFERIK